MRFPERGGNQQTVADERLHQRRGRQHVASRMEIGQARQRVFDQPVGSVPGAFVIELAATLDPLQQVDVGAGVRRTQRRNQRNLVGRILDRPQTGQQVANLLCGKDQLRRRRAR